MSEIIIRNNQDIDLMLDEMLEDKFGEWWDSFYSDKERQIPFLVNYPSENLIEYLDKYKIKPGFALDIGCGNGRNSMYLAQNGFTVTALDFSAESLRLAKESNSHKNIKYINVSFFDYQTEDKKYDLVYDGGCFHHIPPHRRFKYLEKVRESLKDDGFYGMEIFNEEGGAVLSDYEVYKEKSMKGGMAYSKSKLKKVLEPFFTIIELRKMNERNDEIAFGKKFCWAIIMKNADNN